MSNLKCRVGFFIENYSAGGLERMLVDLVNSFSPTEYVLTVFCAGDNEIVTRLFQSGIPPFVDLKKINVLSTKFAEEWVWSKNPPKYIWLLFLGIIDLLRWFFAGFNIHRCKFFLKNNPVDVLYVLNGGYPAARSCLSTTIAAHNIGIKTIVLIITAKPQHRRWPLLERLFDRYVSLAATYVISNSNYLTQIMIIDRGFDPQKAKTILGGIQVSPPPSINTVQEFRKKWFLQSPCIGSVAVLQYHKGQRFLIEALEILKVEFPSISCLLVGDGPERAALERMVQEKDLVKNVIFIGFQKDFRIAIAAMDIFVHPSLEEGFPYVILEAMALQKPIIATRIAGIPEQIIDGESGLLVEPGQTNTLTESLRRLLRDPTFAHKLATKSFLRSKQFEINEMIKAYHQFTFLP